MSNKNSLTRQLRGTGALFAALLMTAAGCHEDGTLYGLNSGAARLDIISSLSASGDEVVVGVAYQRVQGANVPMSSQLFTLTASGDQQLTVPIDLTDCLADATRIIPREGACSVVATVLLRSATGVVFDSSMVGPIAVSVGRTESAQAATLRAVGTVAVTSSKTTLNVNDTASLSAIVKDRENGDLTGRPVVWTTDKPGTIAVTASGKIAAIALGTATITGTVQGVSGTTTITVAGAAVATVQLTLPKTALLVGGTTASVVVARDAANNIITGRDMQFSTSNSSVAGISSTGVITAIALGSSDITATVEGHTSTVRLDVLTPPLAYAFVDQPTPGTFSATGFSSTGGLINLFHTGVGVVTVRFSGFGSPGSATSFGLTVSAANSVPNASLTSVNAHCYVASFTFDQPLTVTVFCESPQNAQPVDAPFRLMVFGNVDARLSSPAGNSFAFHSDTSITTNSYTPPSYASWNAMGTPMQILPDNVYPGFLGVIHQVAGVAPGSTGRYLTARSGNSGRVPSCEVQDLANNPFKSHAACFTVEGAPAKMEHFLVTLSGVVPGHIGASIFVGNFSAIYDTGSWTTGTGFVPAVRTAVGRITVTAPGVNAGTGPIGVMVTAQGVSGEVTCTHFVRATSPSVVVDVSCVDGNGAFYDVPAGVAVLILK